MNSTVRIVHYYPKALWERSGVTESVWRWAAVMSEISDVLVDVWHGPVKTEPPQEATLVSTREIRHAGRSRTTWLPIGLTRKLAEVDLLVLHEGWTLSNRVAAVAARRSGTPYILVPHGVYEPEIVRRQRFRRLRKAFIERPLIGGAAAVHIFYDGERRSIGAMGEAKSFIVAPHGIDIPKLAWRGGGDYIAWFGRFDVEHKGLDLLLRSVASIDHTDRPFIRLHGYDYRDGKSEVARLVDVLELGDSVSIGAELRGDELWEFLAASDGYVHPSRWESFGIALMEALAVGCPVLVNDKIQAAPSLVSAGVAWMAPVGSAEFGKSLVGLAAGHAVGTVEKRRAYVREEHDWARVASVLWDQIQELSDPVTKRRDVPDRGTST
jgi:glycosyltransferase involved in cell wall biosynthesis